MAPKKKTISNTPTNFYAKMDKSFIKEYRNPSYDQHKMGIPFRLLIAGASGSGKTSTLLDLISRFSNTFERLILCVKCIDEPLYNYLRSKLDPSMLEVYEGGTQNIPSPDQYKDSKEQILIVFDDLVNDQNQKPIIDYMIRARKIAGGISCAYLTQSYYKTPKTIRLQCNYLILVKVNSQRDLKLVLNEVSMFDNLKELVRYYQDATKDKFNFLMIDCDKSNVRKNFLEILCGDHL